MSLLLLNNSPLDIYLSNFLLQKQHKLHKGLTKVLRKSIPNLLRVLDKQLESNFIKDN